jgi:hypothetical protein
MATVTSYTRNAPVPESVVSLLCLGDAIIAQSTKCVNVANVCLHSQGVASPYARCRNRELGTTWVDLDPKQGYNEHGAGRISPAASAAKADGWVLRTASAQSWHAWLPFVSLVGV